MTRQRRVKKKSELDSPPGAGSAPRQQALPTQRLSVTARVHDIDPDAAAAVLGPAESPHESTHTPAPTPQDSVTPAETADAPAAEEGEENIYEVMKQHMRRKQEEAEARYAAQKQQRPGPGARPGGRPGPQQPPPPPRIEPVADLSDLAAVWNAARHYLSIHARLLESVLGGTTRVAALLPAATPPEITLQIPANQQNFTNDRARAKLEEALRAITGLPALKLLVEFVAVTAPPPGGGPGAANASAPLQAAQRVPPEVMEAVKKQPLIQELMKRFDAQVTHIEMSDTDE